METMLNKINHHFGSYYEVEPVVVKKESPFKERPFDKDKFNEWTTEVRFSSLYVDPDYLNLLHRDNEIFERRENKEEILITNNRPLTMDEWFIQKEKTWVELIRQSKVYSLILLGQVQNIVRMTRSLIMRTVKNLQRN